MNSLTESIELTYIDRDLILQHGYPMDRLKRALKRWPKQQGVRTVRMCRYELEMLIGELARSFNDQQTGRDEDEVLDLCDRLEYAERTGDGAINRSNRESAPDSKSSADAIRVASTVEKIPPPASIISW